MSKWVKPETFNAWKTSRDAEKKTTVFEEVWTPKERGTSTKPKVYEGRFLLDQNGVFYKRMYYHMYRKDDGGFQFVFCNKTWSFENFCPWCFVTMKLYGGNESDKTLAGNYKRKEKYVSNWYVVSDPRDAALNEGDTPFAGKTWLYEFPKQIESKLDEELKDSDGSLGMSIVDPGEDGYNFIIKVKERGDNELKFPEYGDSQFARKAVALGTDSEIKAIMDSCKDVIAHLKNKEISPQVHKSMLVAELLWTDQLAREWAKHYPNDVTQVPQQNREDAQDSSVSSESTVNTTLTKEQEDLLAQLEDLKF